MSPITTLRLATIDINDGRGNVLHETVVEITTVHESVEAPTVTQHALNQCLGNREGVFDIKGMNFVASARELELASGLLSAELRTSQGAWRKDNIALRAQAMCAGKVWTHELIIEERNGSAVQEVVPEVFAGFGSPCWNLRLGDDALLKVNCLVCDSLSGFRIRAFEHAVRLDLFAGNNDGSFNANGSNFSASARNVRLDHELLRAELRTVKGEWTSAGIHLDSIMRIDGRSAARKGSASYQFDIHLREEVRGTTSPHNALESGEIRQAGEQSPPLYPSLDAFEDSYRICYIEPGQWDDPISCTTSTWLAKDEQRYSCLSYVCGDQNHTEDIRLNSHTKTVTHNLFVAMRRLRWHGVRAIWIDALCINQADNEEKGKQVSRMTATYANAFRVIAWLGSFPLNVDDLEDHVGALEESMFAAFLRRLAFDAHIPDAVQDAQDVTKRAKRPHSIRQTAISLQRVCHRVAQSGWFFRTWTVQEHVMARRSCFAFGDEVIDAKTAFLAIDLAKSHMHVQKCCSGPSYHPDRSDHGLEVFMNRFHRLVRDFEWLVCVGMYSDDARRNLDSDDNAAAVRALVLLVHGRQRKCLDARDKVYAYLGVTWGALGALKADYSISVTELYTKVTWRALTRTGNQDIWLLFMYGTGTSRHRLDGLPSWAVDWDAQPNPSGYTFSDTDFANKHLLYPVDHQSASDERRVLCLDPTGYILAAHGTKFDMIRKIIQPDWPSRHKLTASDGDASVVSKLRYWLTFLGLEDIEQISTKLLLWENFWKLVTTTRTSKTPDTPSAAEIKDLQTRVSLQKDAADESSEPILSLELNPAACAANAFAAGRELFLTDDGCIGLGPATALVGDTLFHIVGSRLPVLLRPCPSTTGTSCQSVMYTLVGICFASDLSDEVVKEAFSQAEEIRIR